MKTESDLVSLDMECRLGVLVEVNCETDFVAKGDIFRSMAQDMAMQIAANAEVEFVAKEDASPDWLESEKQSELQKEDLQSKPENIRCLQSCPVTPMLSPFALP